MPTTPIFYVNNPVSGTNYFDNTPGGKFIPDAGSSITVTVHAYHGADGTGGLLAVTTLVAETFDVTTSTNKSSFSSGNSDTAQVISSNGTNGSDVFAGEVRFSGSQNPGSLSIQATYTGQPLIPEVWVNVGDPAGPDWQKNGGVATNTGTPAAPVWSDAGAQVFVNTGTPAAPVWTQVI